MLIHSAALLFLAPVVFSANAPLGIDDIIKKLEARFEPAQAQPGDSVTLKIELKLADGWHTYPTKQKDPGLRFATNKITLPKDGAVKFTGKVKEPSDPTIREEPLLDIKELHTYPGGGTWECEAKVSPNAKPGSTTVRVRFVVLVVDPKGEGHFAPKAFDLDATIKIAKPAPENKPQDAEKLPPPKTPASVKPSITDKVGTVWILDLQSALAAASRNKKLVFIDFAAVTSTYSARSHAKFIAYKEISDALKEYVCVRLFTDVLPSECFDGKPNDEQSEAIAERNLESFRQSMHGEWPPYYLIVRPTESGKFEKVAAYDNPWKLEMEPFVEFLKKPLNRE